MKTVVPKKRLVLEVCGTKNKDGCDAFHSYTYKEVISELKHFLGVCRHSSL